MDKKKFEGNIFLNKKRKNSISSLKSTEEDIKQFEDNNFLNKGNNEKVIEVKVENEELVAIVEKKYKNGKIKIEEIKTKDLKLENPWILINFYENQNIHLF